MKRREAMVLLKKIRLDYYELLYGARYFDDLEWRRRLGASFSNYGARRKYLNTKLSTMKNNFKKLKRVLDK